MTQRIPASISRTATFWVVAGLVLVVAGLLSWPSFLDGLLQYWQTLTDRNQLKQLLAAYGNAAPLVFILIQILQVLLAPVPGEISGFIGGYLFGTLRGFLYSTIGLTIGSWINLGIGRIMGRRFIRRRIPPHHLERFDALLRRKGLILVLLLFIIPGFPKDYFCLFLGMSRIPIRILVVISAIGRMPGTLMLSLQGAALYERMYEELAVIFLICTALLLLVYRYKETFYRWTDRLSEK